MPTPRPFADVEHGEVLDAFRGAERQFRQAECVRLLKDDRLQPQLLVQIEAELSAVGLVQVGRVDRALIVVIEKARHADAEPHDRRLLAHVLAGEFGEGFDKVGVAVRRGELLQAVGADFAVEPGEHQLAVARADHGAEDRGILAGEPEDLAGPAERGGLEIAFLDEVVAEEEGDDAGDGGPADAGVADDLGAGEGAVGLQGGEDLPLVELPEQGGPAVRRGGFSDFLVDMSESSASSRVRIGVADFKDGWENLQLTTADKEVSHVQEVHRSAIRRRA